MSIEQAMVTRGLAGESRAFALAMDEEDALARYRDEFAFPAGPDGRRGIYLCGNSLGLMSFRSRRYINEELDKWASVGVEGHFADKRPWARIDECVTGYMAEIVGARSVDEVAVMNSLSVNLHLLLMAFFRPTSTRYKILVEDGLFCSDSHIVMSQLRYHGLDPSSALVKLRPLPGQTCLRTDDIVKCIHELGDSLALVMFPGVQYYTGQLFDIGVISAAAHAVGAYVGWDLAHAVGNAVLHLHDHNADFAVWCSYKYLNSGPGGIAGAFLHERHHGNEALLEKRLEGWWGQRLADRFAMKAVHNPVPGAQSFQMSNPCVLAIVSLLGSLEIFHEATMQNIADKQVLITGYLEYLIKQTFTGDEVEQLTPPEPKNRGSQISLRFRGVPVRQVHARLTAMGVISDVRDPDSIRVCPAPLYNSFIDVLNFSSILRKAFDETRSLSQTSALLDANSHI
ncbi:Kynureninase [Plasmodiophora brassicae]|uniref:Kynureninase n=1 Tax=Plasmodiophora brassicae TaxID=37360 RepID=A0A3P3YH39_PLABS|nr:unnamed protein product [Plasmodiophora brassicae]